MSPAPKPVSRAAPTCMDCFVDLTTVKGWDPNVHGERCPEHHELLNPVTPPSTVSQS